VALVLIINVIPLSKLIVALAVVYSIIVMVITAIVSFFDVSGISNFRIIFSISALFEVSLIFILSKGWRKIWIKIPSLNKWVSPDLNGNWEVEIMSTWKGAGSEGIIKGKATIQQTILKLTVNVKTDNSRSFTLVASPFKMMDGIPGLHYMYESETILSNDVENEGHKGAATLYSDDCIQGDFSCLSGNYFTNRNTSGSFIFNKT